MASEQATAAAEQLTDMFPHKIFREEQVKETAEIIDAAFAQIVSEREAFRVQLGSQKNQIDTLSRAIEQWRESDTILRGRLEKK